MNQLVLCDALFFKCFPEWCITNHCSTSNHCILFSIIEKTKDINVAENSATTYNEMEGVIAMRKIVIAIAAILILLTGCGEIKEAVICGEPDVVGSITFNRDYRLFMIANRNRIDDKMAFAEEVLQMCKDNSFKSVLFSYDMGYPTEVKIDVYLTQEDFDDNEMYMEIDYSQEGLEEYDIVNNPEKFELKIK